MFIVVQLLYTQNHLHVDVVFVGCGSVTVSPVSYAYRFVILFVGAKSSGLRGFS